MILLSLRLQSVSDAGSIPYMIDESQEETERVVVDGVSHKLVQLTPSRGEVGLEVIRTLRRRGYRRAYGELQRRKCYTIDDMGTIRWLERPAQARPRGTCS